MLKEEKATLSIDHVTTASAFLVYSMKAGVRDWVVCASRRAAKKIVLDVKLFVICVVAGNISGHVSAVFIVNAYIVETINIKSKEERP